MVPGREIHVSAAYVCTFATAFNRVVGLCYTPTDERKLISHFIQNLFYEVRYIEDSFQAKIDDIAKFITRMYRDNLKKNTHLEPDEARAIQGIIYCRKRETCDQVASELRNKGISAAAFHRGLTPRACEAAAEKWQNAHELARQGKKFVDVIGKNGVRHCRSYIADAEDCLNFSRDRSFRVRSKRNLPLAALTQLLAVWVLTRQHAAM